MDLVGFDAFAHEFEVGVIFLSELLHQTNVLLLHVLKRLASNIHLTQQSIFLLRERDRLRIFQQNVSRSLLSKSQLYLLSQREFLIEYIDLLLHRADLSQGLFVCHLLSFPPLPLLQLSQPLTELLGLHGNTQYENKQFMAELL